MSTKDERFTAAILLRYYKDVKNKSYGEIAQAIGLEPYERENGTVDTGKYAQLFVDRRGSTEEHSDEIMSYVLDLIKNDEAFNSPPGPIQLLIKNITGKSVAWRLDDFSHDKYKTINGTYQIIRPYNGDAPYFVLEVMSIHEMLEGEGVEKNLYMYTHNYSKRSLIYKGQLLLGLQYAFGLLQRVHEKDNRRNAMRAISLFTKCMANGEESFEDRFSLSGNMLRGSASAKKNTIDNPIAIPFIAIRPIDTSIDITEPKWSKVGKKLQYMGGGYLLGDINEVEHPDLYEFCSSMWNEIFVTETWKEIGEDFRKFPILRTMSPEDLEDILSIHKNNEKKPDYVFRKWRDLVTKSFDPPASVG